MLTVDINLFQMWLEGVLLYRDTQEMIAVNETACQEAKMLYCAWKRFIL